MPELSGLDLAPPFSLASSAPNTVNPQLTSLFLPCAAQSDTPAGQPLRLPAGTDSLVSVAAPTHRLEVRLREVATGLLSAVAALAGFDHADLRPQELVAALARAEDGAAGRPSTPNMRAVRGTPAELRGMAVSRRSARACEMHMGVVVSRECTQVGCGPLVPSLDVVCGRDRSGSGA